MLQCQGEYKRSSAAASRQEGAGRQQGGQRPATLRGRIPGFYFFPRVTPLSHRFR